MTAERWKYLNEKVDRAWPLIQPEVVELLDYVRELQLGVALWNATFSRYDSMQANGVRRVAIREVIQDFRKCEAVAGIPKV